MDDQATLDFLKNLLTTKQGTQSSQFGQAMGQQGSQFNANLALQKVIADWQNQLAEKKQAQSEQAQQFGEAQTTKQTSLPYMSLESYFASLKDPANVAANNNFIKNYLTRVTPQSNPSPISFQPAGPSNPYGTSFW